MATLHNEYNKFNKTIKLKQADKDGLIRSRNSIRDKIKKYFREEKPDELQPTFNAQGSFEMNTTVNPIPEYDKDKNKLLKYDLDYGVYFKEKESEDNKRSIQTWHNWVYDAVDDHTSIPSKDKDTCVRIMFTDGHHIDLPIYYQEGDEITLAHKSKGWLESNPVEFSDWFNEIVKEKQQLRRIVRYLKAWRNFREITNTNLKFPSGFILTILAVNNYIEDDNDDTAFRKTVIKIKEKLDQQFKCNRPTTPTNEDLFEEYSYTRKTDFLNVLESLINACKDADEEKNFKKASEFLQKHFGDRFPSGEDKDEDSKSKELSTALGASLIKPKPHAKGWNY